MSLLIAGVLLWCTVHLFPALAPASRSRLISRLGDNPYRGGFSLLIVASLVMIVLGWRRAGVAPVYLPPLLGNPLVPVLVFVSFFLFAAAHAPGNTRRFLRHPMLTGTIVWSVAHLLANGDARSIVLFGGLGAWALASILLINRREPDYRPPAQTSPTRDLMTLAGAAVVFAVVAIAHRWLFGVSPFPGL